MTAPKIKLHKGDLPAGLTFPNGIAIDTETMGLNPHRDRLCLVQLSGGDGTAHLVKFDGKSYDAPNLKHVLSDPQRLKLFHFARFDIAMFMRDLSIVTTPLYCTKVASKLVRTYTDCHGLNKVTSARYTLEQWQQSVARMVQKGARLNAEEQEALVAYLAETYKP